MNSTLLTNVDHVLLFQIGIIILNLFDIIKTIITKVGWIKYFLMGVNGAALMNLYNSNNNDNHINISLFIIYSTLYLIHAFQLNTRVKTVFVSISNNMTDDPNDEEYIYETDHDEDTNNSSEETESDDVTEEEINELQHDAVNFIERVNHLQLPKSASNDN